MKLIIPMAGKGKRMRPHTLTTPKPLIPIAGKPIVERLVTALSTACNLKIDTIGFVISDLAEANRAKLKAIAQRIGAKAQFYEQYEALGTAHAILCAEVLLDKNIIIAFADTLFRGGFHLDPQQESIIWVKKVQDPAAFGVVKLAQYPIVADFVEKSPTFISDLAIIGIYYFREGGVLKEALQQLVNQPINGEYQLTAALKAMKAAGRHFAVQEVTEWMDCGNKAATIKTNQRFLTLLQQEKQLIAPTAHINNSVIIPPVYIGEHVVLNNTVLGPYVAVGSYSYMDDARIKNSIIQEHSAIRNVNLKDSMLGNYVTLTGKSAEVNMGDYNTLVG